MASARVYVNVSVHVGDGKLLHSVQRLCLPSGLENGHPSSCLTVVFDSNRGFLNFGQFLFDGLGFGRFGAPSSSGFLHGFGSIAIVQHVQEVVALVEDVDGVVVSIADNLASQVPVCRRH